MNTIQRFFSNTALIFISNTITKISNSLLFIFIGRLMGPDVAGVFNLGITFYTIAMALSAWGLSDLLIREVSRNRQESSRYLTNYLFIRLLLNIIAYSVLLIFLRLTLPYTSETKQIIMAISLAIFPESIFILFQAIFIAHERMAPPALAAFLSSLFKLAASFWLLSHQSNIVLVTRLIPLSSLLGLLILTPFLVHLLRHTSQTISGHFDLSFSLSQLRYTPGFIVIGLFSTLDFQTDALLISIILTTESLGWFGAAQTLAIGFWMIPIALRSALYPIMTRYHQEDYNKLVRLYQIVNRYLVIIALPIVIGVTILSESIIHLIFTDSFSPSVIVLQIIIWSVLFSFLDVPNSRLMLIYNKQTQAAWITGISMIVNVVLNFWLIPVLGIKGAAVARTASSFVFFMLTYFYVQAYFIRASITPYILRPLIASGIMFIAIWPFRDDLVFIPVLLGVCVYGFVIVLSGAIPSTEQRYLLQSLRQPTKHT